MKRFFLLLFCLIISFSLLSCDSINEILGNKTKDTEHSHTLGEWYEITAATCKIPGVMERCCTNENCNFSEKKEIPTLSHVSDMKGFCANCGESYTPPLATPEITSFINTKIFWNTVNGAEYYELTVLYGNSFEVKEEIINVCDSTTYNLEEYFKKCSSLEVYIRSIASQGSGMTNSDFGYYVFEIPNGTVTNYSAIGTGVNLLNHSYTDMENKSKHSIFNKYIFNRLAADEETPLYIHDSYATFSDNIESYANELSTSVSNKFSVKGSVGYANLAKATMGFSIGVSDQYQKKTYNETQAIFYDMSYEYRGYKVGMSDYLISIESMSNADRNSALTYITSNQFREHASMLQNGTLSPDKFIEMYGTHIITEAIYGSEFTAHYEMLTTKSTASELFGESLELGISAGIQASIYGIDLGLETSNTYTATASTFGSNTTSDTYSKFIFNAKGGQKPVNMTALTFADFSKVSEAWANSIEDKSEFEIIDVPDGSLYFVWDFLGDDYAEAKDILNNYFYTHCENQYKELQNKINTMYQDFFTFDIETGTLTFDLSNLQRFDTELTDVQNVLYESNGLALFDGANRIATIYPKFNGHDIKKVVFIGAYGTTDSFGNIINNPFGYFLIVFDDDWTEDIVVEFKNFAFESAEGQCAIDFSDIRSQNITLIVTGNTYIKGGNSINSNGAIAINATGKTITFEGDGNVDIIGGNGDDATELNQSGYDGGTGIVADEIVFNTFGIANITGGKGGNGAQGARGADGKSYNGHDEREWENDGADGGNGNDGFTGGNGGKGGYAYLSSKIIINSGNVNVTGGKSGDGGNGGNGGNGGQGQESGGWWSTAGDGGDGGNGGKGGDTYIVSPSNDQGTIIINDGSLTQVNGESGNVGTGGFGGDPGPKGMHCDGDNCGQILTGGYDGKDGYSGHDGKDGTIVTSD